MAKTDVILIKNVVGLGGESDQVKVAAGYARNYLIPQGIAVPLSAANKRRIEVLQKRRADREAQELQAMSELAKSVTKLICVVTVKTGEDGKMFGSVTAGQIADELKRQFEIVLEKRKIHVEKPIRSLGEHEIDLRLHHDVHATLKVRVESSTPLPAPAEAPAPAAEKGADKKGEKGGKSRAPKAEKAA
jgi:large subunit ribosomal protein L9